MRGLKDGSCFRPSVSVSGSPAAFSLSSSPLFFVSSCSVTCSASLSACRFTLSLVIPVKRKRERERKRRAEGKRSTLFALPCLHPSSGLLSLSLSFPALLSSLVPFTGSDACTQTRQQQTTHSSPHGERQGRSQTDRERERETEIE